MGPITIGALIAIPVVGAASYLVGKYRERNTSPTVRDYQELEGEHERAKGQVQYLEQRVETKDRDIGRLDAQRLAYRSMAETHKVELPELPEPQVTTGELWEGRRYCGHPEANLRNLAAELKAAGVWDKEVHLRIEILGSEMGGGTGFSTAIKKKWTRNKEPTRDIGPWTFHGTGERALADLTTFLMDDDTGLTKPNPKSKKRKTWVDMDSALVFKIDVAVTEVIKPPKIPEIQIVEVAVVEERVVERIVEKEVFISIPKGREPELCGHTQAEIRDLVEEAFARKAADEEVERLEGLVAGETQQETRDRLARASRAKAARRVRGS